MFIILGTRQINYSSNRQIKGFALTEPAFRQKKSQKQDLIEITIQRVMIFYLF